MGNEKQIDDYIDELYEENQIYVEKELEYADKCHKLEEEIGCPLEAYVKATISGIWYSMAGVMKHCFVNVIDANKIIFAMKGTNIWFGLSDYKKTWWLKEDKTE